MKIYKNILGGVAFLLLITVLSSVPAFGDTSCQPIYGGGQTCVQSPSISINKTVQDPQTGNFVDNLSINDPKYTPGQNVTFQIAVTNTGNTSLSNIDVSDIFPQFVDFVSGPGNFDAKSKNLSFTIDQLDPNQTKTYTVVGKISSNLPQNASTLCVVNQAVAAAGNSQSQDNAQFCIQNQIATTKGGLPVMPPTRITVTPPTGPEALPLLALIPSGFLGLILKRLSINSTLKEGGER
ncbi:DUF11 domain-containing protein [Patescibacteria group bacterium]|nr:DUF11 domain-containing protein [Patescibacteria group bacterium]MCL5010585.1 DUF11 domain-containing protein [Patescibacteria group bacterium]